MRRRALIGALSIAFLVPLISVWCTQCVGGGCSTGAMTESLSPATAEAPCHSAPAGSGLVTAADSDCCGMAMGPVTSSAVAPIEAVHFGFHLGPAPGDEVSDASQITFALSDQPPPPSPQGASTPLFTLHSSLLL